MPPSGYRDEGSPQLGGFSLWTLMRCLQLKLQQVLKPSPEKVQKCWKCFFHLLHLTSSLILFMKICMRIIYFLSCESLFLSLNVNVLFDLLYFCQTLPLSPFQSLRLHLVWRMTLTSSCQRQQVNCVYIQVDVNLQGLSPFYYSFLVS